MRADFVTIFFGRRARVRAKVVRDDRRVDRRLGHARREGQEAGRLPHVAAVLPQGAL